MNQDWYTNSALEDVQYGNKFITPKLERLQLPIPEKYIFLWRKAKVIPDQRYQVQLKIESDVEFELMILDDYRLFRLGKIDSTKKYFTPENKEVKMILASKKCWDTLVINKPNLIPIKEEQKPTNLVELAQIIYRVPGLQGPKGPKGPSGLD